MYLSIVPHLSWLLCEMDFGISTSVCYKWIYLETLTGGGGRGGGEPS